MKDRGEVPGAGSGEGGGGRACIMRPDSPPERTHAGPLRQPHRPMSPLLGGPRRVVSVEPNSPAQTIHGAKNWSGHQAAASCGLGWPPGPVDLAGGLRGHGVMMMASLSEKGTYDAAWDISVQDLLCGVSDIFFFSSLKRAYFTL